jgi:hypothetical protein
VSLVRSISSCGIERFLPAVQFSKLFLDIDLRKLSRSAMGRSSVSCSGAFHIACRSPPVCQEGSAMVEAGAASGRRQMVPREMKNAA